MPVEGFPHLRVTRWLSTLQQEVDTRAAARQWVQSAAREAKRGWRAELTRLSGEKHAWRPRLEHCIGLLAELTEFRGVPETEVPDNYVFWKRALGVYPVTRWMAQPFINRYHRDMTARMEEAGVEPAVRYLPPRIEGRAPVPARFSRNPLEVPAPGEYATRALLHHYAPALAPGADNPDNRPGRIRLWADRPDVDTGETPAYYWSSWTRFEGRALLQLNYKFWFTRRPPQQSLDLYAGELDSVIWRVTLKPDGSVLFYDSIHSCGCYHKVFPVDPSLKEAEEIPGDRPVFAPEHAPDARDTRVELLLEPDTHYLVAVSALEPDEGIEEREYHLRDADVLRRLPRNDDPEQGFDSLYDHRGLIPASRRPERWVLWPLGIRSAGAMRQPGTHAIAFIGRRHFDDPELPDILFEREQADSARGPLRTTTRSTVR